LPNIDVLFHYAQSGVMKRRDFLLNSKFDLSGYEVVKQEHTILKERREKLGLTQQQVADAASCKTK